MKLITDILQGTQEWHNLRNTKITATDYACCIAPTKYKSKKDVIASKLGKAKPFTDNIHTQRGKELEPYIHDLIADSFDGQLIYQPIFLHDNNICMASLDAISSDFVILFEYKTRIGELTKELRLNYIAQTKHGMYCSGAKEGRIIICYVDDNNFIIEKEEIIIKYDEQEYQEWLIYCDELWQEILTAQKYCTSDLALEFNKLMKQKEQIESQLEVIKLFINNNKIQFFGDYKITYATRKQYDYERAYQDNIFNIVDPIIDYEKTIKQANIEMSDYITKTTDYQIIKEIKNEK